MRVRDNWVEEITMGRHGRLKYGERDKREKVWNRGISGERLWADQTGWWLRRRR
jgi:hypothetical protein